MKGRPDVAKKHGFLFLKSGDERIPKNIENIILIDRGRGEFDHHGLNSEETSASMVAKKLGLADDPVIQKLLRHVELNDLRGITQPFDVADIIKKTAHSSQFTDEQRMELGLRIISDVVEFRKLELERDSEFTRDLIQGFMKKEGFTGPKLQKYYQQLQNSKFTRDLDLAEILTAEKELHGESEAKEFGDKLFQVVTEDERNFQKALEELEKTEKIDLFNDLVLVVGHSNNPVYNRAARWRGAAVIVQKSDIGVQIYFDFKKIKKEWIDYLMAAIRLEEQIFYGRRPLITDFETLRRPGRINGVKAWYYFVSGDTKGGRFIQNRSLTAPDPDIPGTKIPLKIITETIQLVFCLQDKFDFQRYLADQLKKYNIPLK